MSSAEEKPKWSVFEEVKDISVAPEALMAGINSAIAALEYARAATFLQRAPPSSDDENVVMGQVMIVPLNAFSNCRSFPGEVPDSNPEETEEPVSDFDEQEEVFVSAIIGKYKESKKKRKSSNIATGSSKWALPDRPPGVSIARNNGGEDREEYYTARSRLPRCSSDRSFDAFDVASAMTGLSRSSSVDRLDFQDVGTGRRAIIKDLVHCEGWPFGLCRKALLLPPLPKSPADSWSWTKSGKMVKTHG
ncbi:hypothetical protein Salat_0607900 [Sesamum alatum]|uniref:Uncharacterized protein n=1 Tax=Sesamum alatum TaxID=300844 RepID=A0AAE2CTY3_9LAMI|nr:hypothetical protein Salat_0607900 [Sesamum alatum]